MIPRAYVAKLLKSKSQVRRIYMPHVRDRECDQIIADNFWFRRREKNSCADHEEKQVEIAELQGYGGCAGVGNWRRCVGDLGRDEAVSIAEPDCSPACNSEESQLLVCAARIRCAGSVRRRVAGVVDA